MLCLYLFLEFYLSIKNVEAYREWKAQQLTKNYGFSLETPRNLVFWKRVSNSAMVVAAAIVGPKIVEEAVGTKPPISSVEKGTSTAVNKPNNIVGEVANEAGKGNATTTKPATGAENAVNNPKLNSQLVGEEISGGHAYDKHVTKQGEFKDLGITTKEQFASHIEKVVSNPTSVKELNNGRIAYWDQSTGTVVIRNPKVKDGGTAFRPTDGRQYFDDLN